MKKAIVGTAFFIGGAILINAEAMGGAMGVLGLFGAASMLAGMGILIYALTVKSDR